MKQERSALQLLRRIPCLKLEQVEDTGCCGAAGSHLIYQAELARALRSRTMESINRIEPEIILTSNTGCNLHLRAGLRESGVKAELLHPIQLIDRLI
ncbi:MAG: (Fe-S)-binding protein, partial [Proteobacteria bacterium]|nr:(Fe-S)-binding protein [Pseudomonadota bacterium]